MTDCENSLVFGVADLHALTSASVGRDSRLFDGGIATARAVMACGVDPWRACTLLYRQSDLAGPVRENNTQRNRRNDEMTKKRNREKEKKREREREREREESKNERARKRERESEEEE